MLKKIILITFVIFTVFNSFANSLELMHQNSVANANKELKNLKIDVIQQSIEYWSLASGLDSLGKHKEALSAIELAVQAKPDDLDFQVTYAKILRQNSELDKGLDVINKLTNPLREKASASKTQQEAMVLVLGDKAEFFLAETHLYIAKQNWGEAIKALSFAHDIRDSNNFYPYRNLWYLTLKAKSGLTNEVFERSINPTQASNNHYGKLLKFWFAEGSLEEALALANKKPRDTDRQDATAEVLFFAAMKEKYISKNQVEADKLLMQLASLKPFGNTEWSLVESFSK